MDEASSQPGRPQVRVLLGRSHFDVPHFFPHGVQQFVHRVHAGMVGCHRVTGVDRYSVGLYNIIYMVFTIVIYD